MSSKNKSKSNVKREKSNKDNQRIQMKIRLLKKWRTNDWRISKTFKQKKTKKLYNNQNGRYPNQD